MGMQSVQAVLQVFTYGPDLQILHDRYRKNIIRGTLGLLSYLSS